MQDDKSGTSLLVIMLHGDYLRCGLGRKYGALDPRWSLHGVSPNANLFSTEPEINGRRPTFKKCLQNKKYGAQYSSVDTAVSCLRDDLRNLDYIPAEVTEFSLRHSIGQNRGNGPTHHLLYSTRIKNAWSYASTLHHVFVACCLSKQTV